MSDDQYEEDLDLNSLNDEELSEQITMIFMTVWKKKLPKVLTYY